METATRGKIFFILLAVTTAWFGTAARAANLGARPSLTLSTAWDSNIFNAERDEVSDYVFRAALSLLLSLAGPTTTAELTGAIEGEKYAEHDELDDDVATKTVEFRLTRTGPRMTIIPSGRFVETNDTTRRDIFALAPPPPGAGVIPAESVITERVQTREYLGALQISYRLSPTLTLDLGGWAQKREYSGNTSGLTGSRTARGSASLMHAFTARASAGIFFDTDYNSFDDAPNSRSYTGGLRGTYLASEHTTLTGSAGATLLREHTVAGDATNDQWFPAGSASVDYVKQDFRATLLGSYAITGGGSFADTTERATVSLALSDRFTPRWSWNLSGSFQRNRPTNDQFAARDRIDYATAGAGVRYEVASWASVGLSGSIYRQRSDSSLGLDVDRGIALLDLTLANTFRLF